MSMNELETKIDELRELIAIRDAADKEPIKWRRLDKLPDILREDGYPDVQAFMATYREAEAIVEQYNRDLAEWERQVKLMSRSPRPPERESVRNRLRQLQEQGRQQKPRKQSFDRDSR